MNTIHAASGRKLRLCPPHHVPQSSADHLSSLPLQTFEGSPCTRCVGVAGFLRWAVSSEQVRGMMFLAAAERFGEGWDHLQVRGGLCSRQGGLVSTQQILFPPHPPTPCREALRSSQMMVASCRGGALQLRLGGRQCLSLWHPSGGLCPGYTEFWMAQLSCATSGQPLPLWAQSWPPEMLSLLPALPPSGVPSWDSARHVIEAQKFNLVE